MPDLFDIASDFQVDTNDSKPWAYGYSAAGGGAYKFIAFDTGQVMGRNGARWTSSSYSVGGVPTVWQNTRRITIDGVGPGQLSLHPGPRPNGDFAVVRFVSREAGIFKVAGRFYEGDRGITSGRIVLNGAFDAPLQSFSVLDDQSIIRLMPLTLNVGDTLDFIVGNNGNFLSGNTPLTLSIQPSRVGFSLSGGGAKGDFEVGALQLIYEIGWRPNVLTCTSVGSVNGLKLAEGEALGQTQQGLQGLTALWLSLADYRGFFQPEQWLSQDLGPVRLVRQYILDFASANSSSDEGDFSIHPLTRELQALESAAADERLKSILDSIADDGLRAVLGAFIAIVLPAPVTVLSAAQSVKSIADMVTRTMEMANVAISSTSVFTLEPTRQMAEHSLDLTKIAQWSSTGNDLRMAAVGLGTGKLVYIDQNGHLSDRDGVQFFEGRILAPECEELRLKAVRLAGEIDDLRSAGRMSAEVRSQIENLKQQLVATKQRLDKCLRSQPNAPTAVKVGLIDAMIASAAMPVFFPPVGLGNSDRYVDGGIREVTPVKAALDCGANTLLVIEASKAEVSSAPLADTSSLPGIATRSLMDIAINEIARDDIEPFVRSGLFDVRLIQPRVDIHSTFVIYPAFIRNRMAYGYMCAADVLAPPADLAKAARCRKIADRISILRYCITRLECWQAGRPIPPRMVTLPLRITVLPIIMAMKSEIAGLVAERVSLGGMIPPVGVEWGDPQSWSDNSRTEVHPWSASTVAYGASIVTSAIPEGLRPGEKVGVHIEVKNTGTATWRLAENPRLWFREGFGLGDLPISTEVVPGGSCAFDIQLPAPSPPAADFECQMIRGGSAQHFGDRSIRVRVVLKAHAEPIRCKEIRDAIKELKAQITFLQGTLTGNAQSDARIRREVSVLQTRINNLGSEASVLSCAV